MTLKRNHARQQPPEHTPNEKRLNYFTKARHCKHDWLEIGGVLRRCFRKSLLQHDNMLLQLHTEDGEHSVGWHADDEHLFQGKHHDCRIMVCLKLDSLPTAWCNPETRMVRVHSLFVIRDIHWHADDMFGLCVCAGRRIQEHNMIIYDYTVTLNRLMYKGHCRMMWGCWGRLVLSGTQMHILERLSEALPAAGQCVTYLLASATVILVILGYMMWNVLKHSFLCYCHFCNISYLYHDI